MRIKMNFKEMKDYKKPFTAVVDRGHGLEIWNYKTGLDAEKHKSWLYKKGIPTAYVAIFDNTTEAENTYPEAETHGEQIKAGRTKSQEEKECLNNLNKQLVSECQTLDDEVARKDCILEKAASFIVKNIGSLDDPKNTIELILILKGDR